MSLLLPAVASVLRTPKFRHAGEWARERRILSRSESSEPGPFNPDRTPYFTPIYEVCASGKYRWVCVICASQMSKTEFELNLCGHSFDTMPGPVMVALPDKTLAKRFSKARMAKMLKYSPTLYEKLAKSRDMDNVFEKYVAGNQLKIAWATSATQLCSDPAKMVVIDELDRMPDDVEDEGDPVSLSDARGATYPDFLLVICTTVTIEGKSKGMAVFLLGTQQLFCSPCTHCGHYFAPWFKDLWYPKSATSGLAKRKARIICPDCGKPLDDSWRLFALQPGVGKYIAPGQRVVDGRVEGDLKETSVASFRIPGLLSPWVTIGESAAKWIDANNESSDQAYMVKTVINTRFGELYQIDGDAPQEEEMEPLKASPNSPKLPAWALLLTAGVDVQKRGIYVAVRAWGPAGKSHGFLFTYLPGDTNEDAVWQDLEEKILKFPFETEEKRPRKLFVDFMGVDRRYREEMVDVFVGKHKDKCVGVHGQFKQVAPVRLSTIDVTYEGRPKITGMRVLSLNDTHFKLAVFNKITRGPKVDDAWFIHADATEEYCLQVISEELITLPNGRVTWKKRRKDNHALDCEKINLALARWKNFNLLREPQKDLAAPQRKVTQAQEFREM